MNRTQKILLGSILIIIGAASFIVASFNLKYDAAWLSVGLISVISASVGTKLIDSK